VAFPTAGASTLWRRIEIAGAAGSQSSRFVTAMMRAVVAAWPDSGGYLHAARELVDHPYDPTGISRSPLVLPHPDVPLGLRGSKVGRGKGPIPGRKRRWTTCGPR
jgi:hypothetical protein